jgi:hypothetical protein
MLPRIITPTCARGNGAPVTELVTEPDTDPFLSGADILRDSCDVGSVMGGERKTVCVSQLASQFRGSAENGFSQFRSQNRDEVLRANGRSNRRPLREFVGDAAAEAWLVPEPATFQTKEQRRHPAIGASLNYTARNGHGPIDLIAHSQFAGDVFRRPAALHLLDRRYDLLFGVLRLLHLESSFFITSFPNYEWFSFPGSGHFDRASDWPIN